MLGDACGQKNQGDLSIIGHIYGLLVRRLPPPGNSVMIQSRK